MLQLKGFVPFSKFQYFDVDASINVGTQYLMEIVKYLVFVKPVYLRVNIEFSFFFWKVI